MAGSFFNNTNKKNSLSDLLLWETIERSRFHCNLERRQQFNIVVYKGALDGVQVAHFESALTQVIQEFETYYNPGKLKISVFSISTTDIVKHHMSPTNLVDKLLDSDVHFILSHIHQSILDRNLGWTMDNVLRNLERLKYHNGFPTGEALTCPVFTQDKFEYITRIPGCSIPTMKVPIQPVDTEEFDKQLSRLLVLL